MIPLSMTAKCNWWIEHLRNSETERFVPNIYGHVWNCQCTRFKKPHGKTDLPATIVWNSFNDVVM